MPTDRDFIAAAIMGEAGNQDEIGMALVADVLANRVNAPNPAVYGGAPGFGVATYGGQVMAHTAGLQFSSTSERQAKIEGNGAAFEMFAASLYAPETLTGANAVAYNRAVQIADTFVNPENKSFGAYRGVARGADYFDTGNVGSWASRQAWGQQNAFVHGGHVFRSQNPLGPEFGTMQNIGGPLAMRSATGITGYYPSPPARPADIGGRPPPPSTGQTPASGYMPNAGMPYGRASVLDRVNPTPTPQDSLSVPLPPERPADLDTVMAPQPPSRPDDLPTVTQFGQGATAGMTGRGYDFFGNEMGFRNPDDPNKGPDGNFSMFSTLTTTPPETQVASIDATTMTDASPAGAPAPNRGVDFDTFDARATPGAPGFERGAIQRDTSGMNTLSRASRSEIDAPAAIANFGAGGVPSRVDEAATLGAVQGSIRGRANVEREPGPLSRADSLAPTAPSPDSRSGAFTVSGPRSADMTLDRDRGPLAGRMDTPALEMAAAPALSVARERTDLSVPETPSITSFAGSPAPAAPRSGDARGTTLDPATNPAFTGTMASGQVGGAFTLGGPRGPSSMTIARSPDTFALDTTRSPVMASVAPPTVDLGPAPVVAAPAPLDITPDRARVAPPSQRTAPPSTRTAAPAPGVPATTSAPRGPTSRLGALDSLATGVGSIVSNVGRSINDAVGQHYGGNMFAPAYSIDSQTGFFGVDKAAYARGVTSPSGQVFGAPAGHTYGFGAAVKSDLGSLSPTGMARSLADTVRDAFSSMGGGGGGGSSAGGGGSSAGASASGGDDGRSNSRDSASIGGR